MAADEPLVEGNNPTFENQFLDDAGVALDISGSSPKLRYRNSTGAVVVRPATITEPLIGKVIYKFIAGELLAGRLEWEWDLDDSSGDNFSQNVFPFQRWVRKKLL